jgi:hypothetical protein
MNEENYILERVDDQINWYDKKSQSAQHRFKLLRGFEICAAASIPLIAGFAKAPFPVTLVLAVVGALIAIVSAITSLNQYQENWTGYRGACESLRQEKFLFVTKAEPYHEGQAFSLFVQRVESLLSRENGAWAQYTQESLQKTSPDKDESAV